MHTHLQHRYQSAKAAGLREQFYESLEGAVRSNPELGQFQGKATADITPLDALDIFTKTPDEDLPLLWLNAEMSRPERLVLTHLPVPPVCIRPSVKMDGGASNEDDLTCKLASIIDTSNAIREHMAKGQAYESLLTTWDSLNLEVAQCVVVMSTRPPARRSFSFVFFRHGRRSLLLSFVRHSQRLHSSANARSHHYDAQPQQ